MYEQHENIYQHAGKCDDQQNLKDIIDAAMVSNTEGVTDNSPNEPMTSKPSNKQSARKSLHLFTKILNVRPKTANCRIVAEKSKRRSIKVGNSLYHPKPCS